MRRNSAAAAAVVILFAFSFSLPATAQTDHKQIGVLERFATLPSGLLAEGLAVHGSDLYVGTFSFSASDGIVLVLDHTGAVVKSIKVAGFPLVGELAFHDGELFAVAGNLGTGHGVVVRINPVTGVVTTLATGFKLPNGLAINKQGNLFVTDLLAGTVSKVTPKGSVSIFASGPLLVPVFIPAIGLSLGPNDLVFGDDGEALYVSNIGKGTVVRIEIGEDGNAGAMANFATGIRGPDGMAFDGGGNLYVTASFANQIWVFDEDGSGHQLPLDASHATLSNPSNLAFVGHRLYITNLALGGTSTVLVVNIGDPQQDDQTDSRRSA
jgi:DNA-binding beta-propeller fold protein YncE